MDASQIHLVLNHFPIIGTLIGIIILLIGIFKNNKTLLKTGLILFVVLALITIPTYLTGEEAEHAVEHFEGTSEHYLEEHEELGEFALWAMIATGAVSLLALVFGKIGSAKSKTVTVIALVLAVASLGIMVLTADHGGKIRRPELQTEHSESPEASGEHEESHRTNHESHHDDD